MHSVEVVSEDHIETIMDDVPNGNLAVSFYTDTIVGWIEKEEGVWDCIQSFAKSHIKSQSNQG